MSSKKKPKGTLSKKRGRRARWGNVQLNGPEQIRMFDVEELLEPFSAAFQCLHALKKRCGPKSAVDKGIAEADLKIFMRDLLCFFDDKRMEALRPIVRELKGKLRNYAFMVRGEDPKMLKKYARDKTEQKEDLLYFTAKAEDRVMIGKRYTPDIIKQNKGPLYRPKLSRENRSLAVLCLQKGLNSGEEKWFEKAAWYLDISITRINIALLEPIWADFFKYKLNTLKPVTKGRKRYNSAIRFVAAHCGVSPATVDKDVRDYKKRNKNSLQGRGLLPV